MTYTIGELAKAFGLSRSTLLYYDRLGLLKPSSRSYANYRFYNEQDYQRLEKIVTYRDAGVGLEVISVLLSEAQEGERISLLEAHLGQLNSEIAELRKQQQVTVELLASKGIDCPLRSMSKLQWVQILESIGMSESDMQRWHHEFERRMPEAHQDFLESLNISVEEIKVIRQRSQKSQS